MFSTETSTEQIPSNNLGGKCISFHNFTFNFGGVKEKEEDVEKIVSKIVDKLPARNKGIVEKPVSIL